MSLLKILGLNLLLSYGIFNQVAGQRLLFEVGIQNEADFSRIGSIHQVNDSLFILTLEDKYLKVNNNGDARLFGTIGYRIVEKTHWYFNVITTFNKRYVATSLGETEIINGDEILINRGIIPNRNTAFLFFGNGGYNIRRLSLECGIGIGLHLRDISAVIDANDSYGEVYNAVQYLQKTFTFNYQFQASILLLNNTFLFARFQESIGSTTKPISINNDIQTNPSLKWRSLGIGFAFHLNRNSN